MIHASVATGAIWFVTPAFQRYDLSAVCFEQRRRVMDELALQGIEARCVVIANDHNLDLARALDFDVVSQSNHWLGRKFNDGMEYAAHHGAEWIVPIGSDSWIDAAYFTPLPAMHRTRTSQFYCAVTGDRLAQLEVQTSSGAGPYMFHRRSLMRKRFRPADDKLRKGIDSSTLVGIGEHHLQWRHQRVHPFQYIGFRGVPHITKYERLMSRWGVAEHTNPWEVLAQHYPVDLVERARAILCAS